MAYTTVVAGTTITAAWGNANVRDQTVTPFASSAARASAIVSPVEGMVSHLNDVNTLGVYSGSAWSTIGPVHGAWIDYTPTLTQSATVTKTVTYAAYHRVGRLIFAAGRLDVTGAGTANNAIEFGLPVAARTTGATIPIGVAWVFDATGSVAFTGTAIVQSASVARMIAPSAGAALADRYVGVTIAGGPTLASTDSVLWQVQYEAAADA